MGRPRTHPDLKIGARFGRLTVLSRAELASAGQARLKVRCECGTDSIVTEQRLRTGHIESCGCLSWGSSLLKDGSLRHRRRRPASAVLCQSGGDFMTRKPAKSMAPTSDAARAPPVRVKLQRLNCNLAKAHPPDGDGKVWWNRLKKTMGTSSSAFVDASLFQLQAAARLPGGGISELAVNSALAIIEGAAPKGRSRGGVGAANGLHPHGGDGYPRPVRGRV
jgi:hypothetical protein